jgi:hypothetical protein
MVQVEQVPGELPGSLTRWRITTFAQTKAEAFAKAAKIEEVNPEAFKPLPVTAPEIAHSEGHTADGAGVIPHAIAEAMLRDLQDDDEGAPGEPPRCKTGGCE